MKVCFQIAGCILYHVKMNKCSWRKSSAFYPYDVLPVPVIYASLTGVSDE